MNKTIGPGNFNTTTVIMLFYAQKHGPERAQTQAATSYNYPTPGPGPRAGVATS